MADNTKPYGRKFRAKMVQRMSGPGRESATALSRKVGVPQATLSRWLREAGRVGVMNEKREESPPGARVSKRPEDWTAEEKLKVVAEAVGLDDTELGVLLRREGLHEAQLEAWRKALLGSLDKPGRKGPSVTEECNGSLKEHREDFAGLSHESFSLFLLKCRSRPHPSPFISVTNFCRVKDGSPIKWHISSQLPNEVALNLLAKSLTRFPFSFAVAGWLGWFGQSPSSGAVLLALGSLWVCGRHQRRESVSAVYSLLFFSLRTPNRRNP